MRQQLLVATFLTLVVAPGAAAGQTAVDAKSRYTRTFDSEQELRRAAPPPARESRLVIRAYEEIALRYPTSGFTDDALWRAGALAADAYAWHKDRVDLQTAERLLRWLVREYPHSSNNKLAVARLAELVAADPVAEPVHRTPAPTAPAPVAAAKSPVAVTAPSPTPSSGRTPPAPAPARTGGTAPGASPVAIRSVSRTLLPDAERIIVELDAEVAYSAQKLDSPSRVFFDLQQTSASKETLSAVQEFTDDHVRRVRLGRHPNGVTRVVMELDQATTYSVFTLYSPFRLVVDFPRASSAAVAKATGPAPTTPAKTAQAPATAAVRAVTDTSTKTKLGGTTTSPAASAKSDGATPGDSAGAKKERAAEPAVATSVPAPGGSAATKTAPPPPPVPVMAAAPTVAPPAVKPPAVPAPLSGDVPRAVIEAERPIVPTVAPNVAAEAAVSAPSENAVPVSHGPATAVVPRAELPPPPPPPAAPKTAVVPPVTSAAAAPTSGSAPTHASTPPPKAPASNVGGGYSLARQLGLGVSRIVIDPGHGGHDPGAMGGGLTESATVLDIALRLEKLLQDDGRFDVVMTRRTDVFIPLEERTAIANRESADLFLSIHVNSSPNSVARGIETYYLNFASDKDAEAVAARENSTSGQPMRNLTNIVQAIALNTKLDESRDFAATVQRSMVRRVQQQTKTTRDLGVKRAPFVVLIGAVMPSVLAEVSFISNAPERQLLKTAAYKQRIAQALFDAVQQYQRSLKTVTTVAQQPGR
ncbi:MAG: N-acetylmuramoyl-L-alanine amidase [Vicinamibacterales bacterium]